MSILNIEDSLILIIDIQEKLLNAAFNKEQLLKNAAILTKTGKILNIPTIATEQYPNGLGNTVNNLKNELSENNIFEKISFSALDNKEIDTKIKEFNKKQIIIYGIETHICVNQTASTLIDRNYEVYIIQNACGSRTEENHNAGLARMKGNGAKIVTSEIAVFEWLKSAKHPNFKEIQALIK